MLRIVIEQDNEKASTQVTEAASSSPQATTTAISGGAPAPHITKIVNKRSAPVSAMMSQQMAMGSNTTAQTVQAKDAGPSPRWLEHAVKSLVSKAAEQALRNE